MQLLGRAALVTRKNKLCVAGVGDWVVSGDAETTLATYALGSCIGVVAYSL